MRNILHVVNISFVLPYYLGDQINFFKNRGYNISIACSPSKHLEDFGRQKKIDVYPVEVKRSISVLTDIKSIFLLYRLIKKNKIDTIVGHTPKGALLAMIAGFIARVENRIYFRHGIVFETSKGFKKTLLINIEKLTAKLATKIVNVSTSVQQKIKGYGLDYPEKNILLNKGTCNGIDLAKFSEKHDQEAILSLKEKYKIRNSKVIGYIGRLVNDKGINELIKAWSLILNEDLDIKLMLVGPYEDRDGLPKETREFIRNCDSVIEVGHVDEVVGFYEIMEVLILPSYREGFPTVVLEASAMSLPIITTRSTGCIDSIVDGFTGIFAEIDPEDIKNKILYYINNQEVATNHGKNGKKFVEQNFAQELIWLEMQKELYA